MDMTTLSAETFTSRSPEETMDLAKKLAKSLRPGTLLALHGGLGAGKTCFVKGLAAALHIDRHVTSPTFTLVNEYAGTMDLAHIDLYRLHSADEVLASGLEDYFDPVGMTVIEWAERAEDLLPKNTIHVFFEANEHETTRRIRVQPPD